MTRLIVISNRVTPADGKEKAGGLAVALTAALREYSGIWFGWSGGTTDHFTGEAEIRTAGGVSTALVDLEPEDVAEYYDGYANATLWPLFHYRIDLTAYDRAFDQGYRRVNRAFARAVAPMIRPGDLIWVHDYHLIPIAEELRVLGVTNRIGFFLHIPWPARQVLTTLPRHRSLVQALFAYDLVGFQTREFVEAFDDYVTAEAGGSIAQDGRLACFGRKLRARAFPIGLDFQNFREEASSPAAIDTYERTVENGVRTLIVGAERLDYSKGIPERLTGFERFLERYPDLARQVRLIQIAPTSRERVEAYQDLRDRMAARVGEINSHYADLDWTPIRYVNRGYTRAELAGAYRACKIGLVTSLRDGMNLVAKEYVAAQDEADPGVLILSRFAGAASQLDQALIINPYDPDSIADAIRTAIAMPPGERRARHAALLANVREQDVRWWRDNFVNALAEGAGAD